MNKSDRSLKARSKIHINVPVNSSSSDTKYKYISIILFPIILFYVTGPRKEGN